MDENTQPHHRKIIRVDWHDYNIGWYYITICTEKRICSLGRIDSSNPGYPFISLSPVGIHLRNNLEEISNHHPYAEIPLYTIMPNHIHLIIHIDENNGSINSSPNQRTVSQLATLIRSIKSSATKFANQNNIPFAWQSRYYDRIIRNIEERNSIADYIMNNVANWAYDDYLKQP